MVMFPVMLISFIKESEYGSAKEGHGGVGGGGLRSKGLSGVKRLKG